MGVAVAGAAAPMAAADPTAAVAAEAPAVVVAVAPLRLAMAWTKVAAPRPMAAQSRLPAAVVQPLTSAGPFAKWASSPLYFPGKMQADDHNRNTDTEMPGSATRQSCTIIAVSQQLGNRWQLTMLRAHLQHCAGVINPALTGRASEGVSNPEGTCHDRC